MPKSVQITSPANPLLKSIRRAVSRGSLTSDGYCVAEGFQLLTEAVRSSSDIGGVLVAESCYPQLPRLDAAIRVTTLPEGLFDSIASTQATQGVVTLVRLPAWREGDLLRGLPLVVVLDGVQDPGNAGAIVRAAEAFGATGIVFGRGSARPENPKTLRASAGSLFRLPHLQADTWNHPKLRMFAAMPYANRITSADRADWKQPVGLVIGSEGSGISDAYRGLEQVAILTRGVESLNAAVAASILLYEAARQRGLSK